MSADSPASRPDSLTPRRPRARRLILSDFRSWATLDLRLDARVVALTGENGAGKTNLLEALSLFSPGRGLRRAEFGEIARVGGAGGWSVSVALAGGPGGEAQLGVGMPAGASGEAGGRAFRIDRAPVASARAFADHLRVVWLTPAMDGLFSAAPGERRRFLDRLVLAVDSDHGARVAAMERALRNRNRLLEQGTGDGRWLDAAEREVAELGVAVAAARGETVSRLSGLIAAARDDADAFPFAEIALEGEIERLAAREPALAVEDHFRRLLRGNRAADAAAGRTLVGPHRGDLSVRHGPKAQPAALCSTGEQKALLAGLVMAHARLVAEMCGVAPLVLLDEIAAHFDARRRAALYETLAGLGGQVWLTGADAAVLGDLPSGALRLRVTPGAVETDG